MADTKFLQNRDGWWRYRRRLPKKVQGLVKDDRVSGVQIKYSLHTSDLIEAQKLRNCANVEWDAIFEAALEGKPQPLTRSEAVRLVQEYVQQTDYKWRNALLSDPPGDEQERREMRADSLVSEEMLMNLDDPRGYENVAESMQALLKNNNRKTTDTGVSASVFAEFVRRGLLELYRRNQARLGDDYSVDFIDQMFSPAAKVRETFGELCDQFLSNYTEEATAKKTSQQQIDQTKSRVDIIRELIGSDLPVGAIDYDICLNIRGNIARLPKSWGPYKG